jgi:hypothetical protein
MILQENPNEGRLDASLNLTECWKSGGEAESGRVDAAGRPAKEAEQGFTTIEDGVVACAVEHGADGGGRKGPSGEAEEQEENGATDDRMDGHADVVAAAGAVEHVVVPLQVEEPAARSRHGFSVIAFYEQEAGRLANAV